MHHCSRVSRSLSQRFTASILLSYLLAPNNMQPASATIGVCMDRLFFSYMNRLANLAIPSSKRTTP